MVMSDVTALQRSDLNEFLFADVGTEASGMMLSVVSLFARQGNDPWREADRLADLPKAVATDSLARSIADMPHGRWNLPDAAAIAARLIGLLPARPARAAGVERRLAAGVAVWMPSTRNAVMLVCVALGIVYTVAALMHPAPARIDGGDVGSFMAAPVPAETPRIGAPSPGGLSPGAPSPR
jgi:hypothetical protein